jgi:small conductance mechanosensitive channel
MNILYAALPLFQADDAEVAESAETAKATITWTDPSSILNDGLIPWALDYGPKVIAALLVFIIGKMVAKVITGAVRKAMVRGSLDESLAKFLGSLVYMLLLTMVAIAALGQLGVQTGSFVALVGAAGLAIGFALQGSLGNFAAGVMIMIFRPFKAGDFVEAGGHAGVIEEVQVFATMMRTGDNKLIILPNSAVTNGSIVNYSAKDTRRIDMVFGIGYDDDIKKAKGILERMVTGDSRVLADPAPTIAVAELADSSVNFVVRPWVNAGDYWPTKFDLTEAIKIEFDKEGISIPFPQQDVHMHQVA